MCPGTCDEAAWVPRVALLGPLEANFLCKRQPCPDLTQRLH